MSLDERPTEDLLRPELPLPDAQLFADQHPCHPSHDHATVLQPALLPLEHGEQSSRSPATDEFVEFICGAVPTELIPPNIRAYLGSESSARLEMAKAAGVQLGELSIADDCLPTWNGLSWDPDVESLHAVIQDRLVDYQVSRDLGDLVRKRIIFCGNRQLSQARALGISIHDLFIGLNLLPTWGPAKSNAEDEPVVIPGGDESDPDSESTASPADDDFSIAPQSEVSLITPLTDVFDDHSSSLLPRRASSSTDWNNSEDSDDGFDDVITLRNEVSAIPIYEDGDLANILHDVQVVNGSESLSEVDLEVYLVEAGDNEDIADLPEVELAIDEEALKSLFRDYEAVDIEIPGMQLFCLNGAEEDVSNVHDLDDLDDLDCLDGLDDLNEHGQTGTDTCFDSGRNDTNTSDHFEEATEKSDGDDDEADQDGIPTFDAERSLVIEIPK